MKLNTLKPATGSLKKSKRVGRGQGSGRGGTSARGHKGAKSRSGYKTKFGFEGGQMPLQRRVPKFGFKNPNRQEYKVLNLDALQKIADDKGISVFSYETFRGLHLISKGDKVKVLGRGAVSSKLDVTAHAFSDTAKSAIESLGGSVTIIE
jgi:large subunit ribosomal protein L15